MSPPLALIGVNELQLPSGVGVLPVRTLRTTEVPEGVLAIQDSGPQSALWPASRTREVKLPAPG